MSAPKRTARGKRKSELDLATLFFGAAKNAGSAVNGAANAVGLSEKVAQSPYGTVAAALAVGYVAGGGLFTPTTGRLVQLALKLATVPFIRSQLIDVAESAVDGILNQTRKLDPK